MLPRRLAPARRIRSSPREKTDERRSHEEPRRRPAAASVVVAVPVVPVFDAVDDDAVSGLDAGLDGRLSGGELPVDEPPPAGAPGEATAAMLTEDP